MLKKEADMATLITTLPEKAFPHEVDALDISTDQPTSVELRYADKVIFKSTLYPIDGSIELRDITSLLEDYMTGSISEFSVWLDGSKKDYTDIIPCKVNIDVAAGDCGDSFFLTRATSKYTHRESKERLYCYASNPTFVVRAVVRIDNTARTIIFRKPVSASGIVGVDVSYNSIFKNVPYEVLQYTVEVGDARVTFRMIPDGMADNVHEFGFINSFMQQEFITLMGGADKEMKVERRHAIVGGQYRNFQVDSVPHWTVNSGEMLDGMTGLFEDFISSSKVWRKEDNCELAITDSDFKCSDANDAIPQGSVTLRETGRRYRHRLPQTVNTFDITFDTTFL